MSTPRLLVIEDEPELGELLSDLLAPDFAVTWVGDPRLALDKLKNDNFAAVLTDLSMPYLSGLQIVQTIRSNLPGLPIVIMTGRHQDDPEVVKVRNLGCQGVVTKPFTQPKDIVAIIKMAIASR